MMTWQKRLFTQTALKVKNGLALGVRVYAIVRVFLLENKTLLSLGFFHRHDSHTYNKILILLLNNLYSVHKHIYEPDERGIYQHLF